MKTYINSRNLAISTVVKERFDLSIPLSRQGLPLREPWQAELYYKKLNRITDVGELIKNSGRFQEIIKNSRMVYTSMLRDVMYTGTMWLNPTTDNITTYNAVIHHERKEDRDIMTVRGLIEFDELIIETNESDPAAEKEILKYWQKALKPPNGKSPTITMESISPIENGWELYQLLAAKLRPRFTVDGKDQLHLERRSFRIYGWEPINMYKG